LLFNIRVLVKSGGLMAESLPTPVLAYHNVKFRNNIQHVYLSYYTGANMHTKRLWCKCTLTAAKHTLHTL